MKICSKCGLEKRKDKYHKDRSKKDGLYSSCKECLSKIYKSEEYKEKRRNEKYYKIKRKHRLKKYGVTSEEYKDMIRQQEGKCAICRGKDKNKKLAIDHCHETGVVRGLLCSNCNRGIGFLKDSVVVLNKAIKYLEKQ